MESGTAAKCTEESKRHQYADLTEEHQFEIIAVETMGVSGGSIGDILRAIGRRLVGATGDPREANWFPSKLCESFFERQCVQYSLSW